MRNGQARALFGAMAAALAIATALSGCHSAPPAASPSQAPSVAPAETSSAPAPAAPTPDISKFVTLTWYISGSGDEKDKDAVLKAVNDYLKPKINAAVDLRIVSASEYGAKMGGLLAARDGSFDLMGTAGAEYAAYALGGSLRELTPLIGQYGGDIDKACGEDFLRACQVGGKQFAVPCNKEKAHAWGPLLLKSLVDKYNIDTSKLKSYDDLLPFFDQIKAGEAGNGGGPVWPVLAAGGVGPWQELGWDTLVADDVPGALYPNGNTDSVTAINQFCAPESVEMYKRMREWYSKGYVNPQAYTQTDYLAMMKTGKYFSVEQPLKPNKFVEMTLTTGQQWVQAQFTPAVMSNREGSASLLALPAAGANPDRTMMFVNLLYSDAFLLNTLDYGIEGTHWVKTERANTIKPGPENSGKKAGYAPGFSGRFGNRFLEFTTPDDAPDIWDQYIAFNKSSRPLNSLGFVFDASKVTAEIAAAKDVLARYIGNLTTGAGTGDVDETVAAMKSELEQAGLQKLLDEETAQYQAWLKLKEK